MPDSVTAVFDKTKYAYTEQTRAPSSNLGKNEFLKILITQLQNQDPTSPMEDTAMIAQMAQFSALEAMTNLSENFSLSQGYSMIGKAIIGLVRDPETGAVREVAGRVDSAGSLYGKPYVMVGNATIFVSDVLQVFDESAVTGDTSSLIGGINLVGKYIRADIGTEEKPDLVEGKVEGLLVKDGRVYVKVGDKEVPFLLISEVSAEPFPVKPPPETEGETPPETKP